MTDFDNYVMRHGEAWVQYLIEQIERRDGIRHGEALDLEMRWNAVMNFASSQVAA